MLKREDLKYGDRVLVYVLNGGRKLKKARVGTRFETWCEVMFEGHKYYQSAYYTAIELSPICRTEIYKALTGDSHDV